jgi:capsular exopolysaccharide synthesis family protein
MDEQPLPAHQRRVNVASRFFNRLNRFVDLLRRKWWIPALTIALGLGIELFLLSNAPPSFLSTGRMIVSVKLSLPNGTGYLEELNNFFGTQTALMQSATVANRALLRLHALSPNLHTVPVLVQVAISPKTSIFNLRALGADPDYVQAYLDACMEEYINLKKEMRQQATDTTKSGILEELATLDAELRQGKEQLVNYESSNSVVFLQDRGNSAGNYLSSLTEKLADMKSELQLLTMLTLDENVERQQDLVLQHLAQSASSPLKTANPGADSATSNPPADDTSPSEKNNASLVGSESDYLKAKQQILLLKAQRDELGEFLRPKHPMMIALGEEIAHKEKLLAIFRQQTQEQLEDRKHTLELQIQNCEGEIKVWEAKSLEISKKMSDYLAIKEMNQRLQTMYDSLLTTERTLDVDRQISQESVAILEPASPAAAAPPQAVKYLSMAGLAGLALGIGILLFLDRLDDRPTSFIEVEEMFDEPILGQIPLVYPKNKKTGIPVLQPDDDRHTLVEANRNLRSSIIFIASPTKPPPIHSIVLTSAIPGDGKSMTSANLAVTLALSGSKVLLVDADLRRGVLHRFFPVPAGPGLAEVLGGQLDWSKAVQPTSLSNLDLLASGMHSHHPGDLFATAALKKFVKEASGSKYEYVLFDTPPVMAADDVSNLAPVVDGVIVVIRSGYTSGRVARAALDLLYLRKMNIIGLVFNAVRTDASEYYYYKYKDYYASSRTA